jgi:hypothetical protein
LKNVKSWLLGFLAHSVHETVVEAGVFADDGLLVEIQLDDGCGQMEFPVPDRHVFKGYK